MSYKSKTKIFGLPFIHITGVNEDAIGFIAIGQRAYGIIAIGQFGVGILFGLGQFMAGFFCIAQFSLGPIMSIGQFGIGWYSIGMIAVGYEGLHMIGYHFVKNNFLAKYIKDWEVFIHNLISIIIFTGLVILLSFLVYVFRKFVFTGIKNGILKIINASDLKNTLTDYKKNNNAPENPNTKKTPKKKYSYLFTIILIIISLFIVNKFLGISNISKVFNKTRYKKITKIGEPATGKILEIKDMHITVNTYYIVKLKVEVFPQDNRIKPYEAELVTLVSRANPFRIGESISIKYDPDNPQEIIWTSKE